MYRNVILALVCGSLVCAAQAANLVTNGSLEEVPLGDALPQEWGYFEMPQGAYKASVVSGGRTGKALQLEGTGEYAGVAVHRVSIEPKKEYAGRGWVKLSGDAESRGVVKLDYFKENGDFLAASEFEILVRPNDAWQPIAVLGRPKDFPEAKFVGLTVAVGGKARALFDDLEMVARDLPESPATLIKRGGLEDIAGNGAPFGWSLYTNEGAKYAAALSDADAKEGWYSLRLNGTGDWAVATEGKVAIEKGKRYTLTGFARAKSGTAQIKFDYFTGNEYLGHTVSDDVTVDQWTAVKVNSELAAYPQATHLSAAVVGLGEVDARYDGLVLTAR
jgi:hypothetical protein